ncbi:MAG TPA: hypothetical protein VFG92_04165 [Agromyces sp.]|nr:hypothetical protein [Agromyces sp.]
MLHRPSSQVFLYTLQRMTDAACSTRVHTPSSLGCLTGGCP